jgi:hypothetical protein
MPYSIIFKGVRESFDPAIIIASKLSHPLDIHG